MVYSINSGSEKVRKYNKTKKIVDIAVAIAGVMALIAGGSFVLVPYNAKSLEVEMFFRYLWRASCIFLIAFCLIELGLIVYKKKALSNQQTVTEGKKIWKKLAFVPLVILGAIILLACLVMLIMWVNLPGH